MNIAIRTAPAALLVGICAPIAQPQGGSDLLSALRTGGLVLVMRHASSPREEPDQRTANPDNITFERQLDEAGRTSATAMGDAFRRLRIPVGLILTSPAYRALETVRYIRLGTPQIHAEIGDGGQSMHGASEAQTSWLRESAARAATGTNTLIVTHLPNITQAFPQLADGLADGEALVFRPDGRGGAKVVARVRIAAWPRMGR